MPEDLASALSTNAKARAFFERLDAANRYAVLFRIMQPAKPQTRAARIERLVEMLAKQQKFTPSSSIDDQRQLV